MCSWDSLIRETASLRTHKLKIVNESLKANLIFKDFSRKPCIFKYFSSLCEPCVVLVLNNLYSDFCFNNFSVMFGQVFLG